MPRPRPPVDAEGYSRAVFHKRANYDGWARPEVVDPTGRQHPHKYVVRFAYYKSDGAEPGWHVSWNDNSECWMDDHEVEDDVEAMRVFAERAVDGAMAAQAARQAKYAEEALLRARLAKRLKNKEAAQAKTAAELEAEKERRKAEEEAARSGIPILYDEDDLQELSSSAAAPIDGEKFAQQKSALLDKVEITNQGVVHGYGVKARVPLEQGTVLLDPTALMHSGDPLEVVGGPDFSEAYISTGNGSYFRIHWFSGDTIFRSAATFWINEARDCEPNVEYKSTYDGRMLSAWRVIRDIAPGDELLVVYSHAANEAEARAPSSEGWQDAGKYVGMYLRRDVEGKKATARVVAYLPTTAADPYIVDGTPRELWRVQYLDSQLKGDTQDLEEEELECSEPSWESPATVQQKKKKPPPPKKEKVTGVVAAGTKVRVTDPRYAGETGVVAGYRDGWHVVTLDADGSGAKFVRLKHLQRADGAPLVLDDVADAVAPASPRVKAAASKPNVGAFASGGGIGRWTPDEDAALRRLHAEHSNTRNKWDVIAAAIASRRTASAAENRWFIIKKAPAPAAAEQPSTSMVSPLTPAERAHFAALSEADQEMARVMVRLRHRVTTAGGAVGALPKGAYDTFDRLEGARLGATTTNLYGRREDARTRVKPLVESFLASLKAAEAAAPPPPPAKKKPAARKPAAKAKGAPPARTQPKRAPPPAPAPAAKRVAKRPAKVQSAISDKAELERRMARDGWTMKRKVTHLGPITDTPRYYKPGDDQAYAGLTAVARAHYPDLVAAVAPRSAPRSASAAAPRKAAVKLRVLDHVAAPYMGRGRYAGIVVAVGRGTVDVHFLDGDFAAGVDAAAVSLYTGRRLRVGAGPALAKGQKIATLKEPTVPLVVVAFDDAYAVVSGPDGNRAYQRDVLRAFDDNDSSDDEAPAAPPLDADAPAAPMDVDDEDAPAAPPPVDDDDDDDDDAPVTPLLAVDETVLVGSNKHVAKVERATKPGDDVVLVRWQSTGHREEIDLSEVERLDLTAGRSSRRSTAAAPPPAAAPKRPTAPPAVEPRKKSRFTGVYRAPPGTGGEWKARIRVRGSQVELGSFDVEEDAARAYDAARVKYRDEQTLNFPGEAPLASVLAALPEVDDDGRVAVTAAEPRRTSPRTSPRSSPRPKTSSPPRTCFGMERPPATIEDVSASNRPCLNPASKRPYERPSLTEVNSADPEDDAELICRPKKSPAKRQRVTP